MCYGPTGDGVAIEDLYPLLDLCGRLKSHPDQATVYRWAQRGLRGTRLRTVLVGGVLHTCDQWVWEFFNRDRNAAPPPDQSERSPVRSPAQDRRALSRAREELGRRGLIPAAGGS